MPRNFWLFKTEPSVYSIDHLRALPGQSTAWEGVRNYQARNLIRDKVHVGDGVLFYHSSAAVLGVAGTCTVVRNAYPDLSASQPQSPYFDPKHTDERPIWYVVDVQLVERFDRILTLAELKSTRGLEEMMVCRRGARLSIQPVRPEEWKLILRLAGKR